MVALVMRRRCSCAAWCGCRHWNPASIPCFMLPLRGLCGLLFSLLTLPAAMHLHLCHAPPIERICRNGCHPLPRCFLEAGAPSCHPLTAPRPSAFHASQPTHTLSHPSPLCCTERTLDPHSSYAPLLPCAQSTNRPVNVPRPYFPCLPASAGFMQHLLSSPAQPLSSTIPSRCRFMFESKLSCSNDEGTSGQMARS